MILTRLLLKIVTLALAKEIKMMRLFLFITAIIFFVSNTFAGTLPLHFEVGDIKPKEKVKIYFNKKDASDYYWPNFLNVTCDILDTNNLSNRVIIKVSQPTEEPSSRFDVIELNQIEHSNLPFQAALKDQKNTFYIHNIIGGHIIEIENLDENDSITVTNCETFPSTSVM